MKHEKSRNDAARHELDTTEIVTDNTWIDSSNVKDYE